MVPSKVLTLHEPDHEGSSLAPAIPKDQCEVIEVSIDNDLNGLNIEDCCVIILDIVSVSRRILDLCSLSRKCKDVSDSFDCTAAPNRAEAAGSFWQGIESPYFEFWPMPGI